MKSFDYLLILPALLLNGLSLWILFHGQEALFYRQLIFSCAGIFLLFAVARVHHLIWIRFSHIFYAINLSLLILVLLIGSRIHGARSWIPLGPINLQPSETFKIVLCLALVPLLKNRERFKPLLFALLAALPIILVLMQPDLGSTASLISICFMGVYLSPLKMRKIIYVVLGLSGIIILSWLFLMKPYQKQRVLTFFFPERAPANYRYQVQQSLIAIGSGEVTGKGVEASTQGQLRFLPAQYTDFIFAVYSEQMGFLGVSIVLLLYLLLFSRILFIVGQIGESEGAYFAMLVMAYLLFHVVYNISMVAAMVPITGIPLPFFSYGGSFLLTCYISIGLLMNISARRFGAQ